MTEDSTPGNSAERMVSELSPDEIDELLAQADHGIDPVVLKQFENLDDFLLHANNFSVFFEPEEAGHLGPMYRQHKAYQRYALLHPEENAELLDTFRQNLQTNPEWQDVLQGWRQDPVTAQCVLDAYTSMSQLVDAQDQFIRDNDGEVIADLLCR